MNALTQMRYDARMSVTELADRAGVARKTIHAIEDDGVIPQADTAGKIGDVFEITPSEFLRRLTTAGDPDGSRAAA